MMIKITVIACLLTSLLANISVSLKCEQCQGQSGYCYAGKGGGLTGKPVRLPSQCTIRNPQKEAIFTFVCSQRCNQGCLLVQNQPYQHKQCTDTDDGRQLTYILNIMYSLENNDKTWSLSYPWCQCGTSRTTWVILFLVLMGVGATGFYFLYWKKRKPKDTSRSQFSAATSINQLQ